MVTIDEGRRGGLRSPDLMSEDWDSLYISLVPLPAAFMVATLVSDLLYWGSGGAFWSEVSEWLLGAGLATGAFAAADGLIQYVASGRIRPSRICWMHVVGNMLALLLSLSNLVYRLNEDRGHAVLPAGISLTAIVVCLLLFTARLGRDIARNDAAADLDDSDLIWEDAVAPQLPEAPPAEAQPRSDHERESVATPRKDRAARRRLEEVDPVE